MLAGKHIVMGITGGISAYKSVDIVSRLVKLGACVDVIMTKNAIQFITPLTFETISARPVVTDMFARTEHWDIEHVALAKKADIVIVAPATANLIAKLCHGIADDMLTTTLLATRAPILLAPAMNTGMWESVITQQNHKTLLERGIQVVGPENGRLACGDSGTGRMSEPERIVEAVIQLLNPILDMKGINVLVTAGPTVERLDPVRFMTNDSSGKMGYALAETARNRGAQVTLVSGPVSLTPLKGIEIIQICSTQDLYNVMLERCEAQDIIVQAAAPSDYRFAKPDHLKIKKQNGKSLFVELVENPDIAKAIGERKKQGQVLIGFAAETNDMIANARNKMASKRLDIIVANDITQPMAGFKVNTNIATLISSDGEQNYPLMDKRELAEKIWDKALMLRNQSEAQ